MSSSSRRRAAILGALTLRLLLSFALATGTDDTRDDLGGLESAAYAPSSAGEGGAHAHAHVLRHEPLRLGAILRARREASAGAEEMGSGHSAQAAAPNYGPSHPPMSCDTRNPIHVLYTVDAGAAKYTAASMFSALASAKEPGQLRFHLMVPAHEDAVALCETLHKFEQKKTLGKKHESFMCPRDAVEPFRESPHPPPDCLSPHAHAPACVCSSLQFRFVVLDNNPALLAKIKEQIKLSMARHSPDRYDELSNIPNFARNWAYEALQPLGVGKVIYIDADTIVKGDLGELWRKEFHDDRSVMIAKSCDNKMVKHIDFGNKIVRALIGDPPSCMYNTGVIVMDIDKLAHFDLGTKINEMYIEHEKSNLWREGIQQPAFILALYHRIQSLDSLWNTTGLGRVKPIVSASKVNKAKILHWTGQRKPWLSKGNFKEHWTPYAI
eukprot:jgi/Tetstr1/465533/TSEL_010202.t1